MTKRIPLKDDSGQCIGWATMASDFDESDTELMEALQALGKAALDRAKNEANPETTPPA